MGEARRACQLFGPDAFLLREIAAGAEEHVRTRDEQRPEFKAIRFDGAPYDMPVVVVRVDDAHRAPVVMDILDRLDGARSLRVRWQARSAWASSRTPKASTTTS